MPINPWHPNDGDTTRKVKLLTREQIQVLEDKMHSEVRHVKKLQFWAVIGLSVAGLGFSAAVFLFNRFAATDVVNKIEDRQEEMSKQLGDHITTETSRMSTIETRGKNVEEDYHWQREQISRIAERVGARRVAPPKHSEGE